MPNRNCLKGIKCPQCGQEDRFRITITTTVIMTDEGSEDDKMGGDQEWDDQSNIECCACYKTGKVADFTIDAENRFSRRSIYSVQATIPMEHFMCYEVLAHSDQEAIEIVKAKITASETPNAHYGISEIGEAKFDIIEVIEYTEKNDKQGDTRQGLLIRATQE